MNAESGDQRVLIAKGHSGMGNRVLSLLSSAVYASLANRELVIDWRDDVYSDHGEDSFDHFFVRRKPVRSSVDSFLSTAAIPEYWNGNMQLPLKNLVLLNDPRRKFDFRSILKYSVDPRRFDYDEPVLVMCPYRDQIATMKKAIAQKHVETSKMNRISILRWIWNREFCLAPKVLERVDEFCSKFWGNYMIGVHVRYTDIKVPLRRFTRTLDKLFTRYADASIFLATDGEDVEGFFRERYGKVVTLTKETSIRAELGRLHACGTSRVSHGIDAVVDMKLLSLCDSLVYSSRSTFAEISHVWSKLDDGSVIDVERLNPFLWIKRIIQDHL